MKKRTAVICQLITLSTPMLLTTATAGGMVVQVREFSMLHAALAAVVMRPARAPGKLIGEISAMPWPEQMIEKIEPEIRRLRRRRHS